MAEGPEAGLVTERSKLWLSFSTETEGWPEKDLHAHQKIQSCSCNSHPGAAGHCSLLDLTPDVSWAVLGDLQRASHGSGCPVHCDIKECYFWKEVMEYTGGLSLVLKMCLRSCIYPHGPVDYSSSSFLLLPRLINSQLQRAERPQH